MIALICDRRPNTIVDCHILNCPCVRVVAVACDMVDGDREGRCASAVDFDGKRHFLNIEKSDDTTPCDPSDAMSVVAGVDVTAGVRPVLLWRPVSQCLPYAS